MNFLSNLLKPAPHLPEIADAAVIQKQYKYWRFRIIYSMFIGYAFYYLARKSFVFAMPGMMRELHLDKGQLGMICSISALTYGISKFFNGVLSDQCSSRYFMAFGLICTGILNIFVGFSSFPIAICYFLGNQWLVPGMRLASMRKTSFSLVFSF